MYQVYICTGIFLTAWQEAYGVAKYEDESEAGS